MSFMTLLIFFERGSNKNKGFKMCSAFLCPEHEHKPNLWSLDITLQISLNTEIFMVVQLETSYSDPTEAE